MAATYHFRTGAVSRGKGHSAIAAAAYRAREKMYDQKTEQWQDYSSNSDDVLHKGIYAAKGAPAWVNDRGQLWNAVQVQEKAINARLARDFVIALPAELSIEQNRWLAENWIKENVTRKGLIADLAIHAPHEHGDERNIHAHILITTRKLGPDGQWEKTKDRSLDDVATLDKWRQSWEKLGNQMLVRHGFEPSLDHRTLVAQDIDREPQIHIGKTAAAMERRGMETDRGDQLREILAANLARDLAKQYEHTVTVQELHRVEVPIEEQDATRSAIDRQRDEDRENDRRRGFQPTEGRRGLMSAIWRLTKTMGGTLSGIILGADRGELMQGRRIDMAQQAAEYEQRKTEQAAREQPAPQMPAQPAKAQEPEARPAQRLETIVQQVIADTTRVYVPDAPKPERADSLTDRLNLAARKSVVEAARQEGREAAAQAVFDKYNGPATQEVEAGEQTARTKGNELEAQPAASAPTRESLSRVEGLLNRLVVPKTAPTRQPTMIEKWREQQRIHRQDLDRELPKRTREQERELSQDLDLDL